ncbi:hypothetical protein COY26_02195 [Candidatus Woesearchaeota archaeon CG_4_10_14_0_2_um_filter_33_10]|nr:MAG: hypothetical protein AUJ83_01105 [Candidatus Woesearchaeota archaeon CG1_02_33_12]PIN78972.1 MAG: hypothetical protein COV14_01335 [Candidatus Woesearchaeota archaeon CG10_big_fil_rev_8_21_14_0_10_33_12]PIU72508.1 MAG: hypothetical protein COS79_02515 [Candidatus Woesearchaeota archaeon CG06_land_8_20_14_3_00_33_13]PIZ53347.1 MAG: hypothetical protein COY26_02195 [Candidatus Woesearchaeota archaeon CG_4_10_14_0_2_um_filter_33_10]
MSKLVELVSEYFLGTESREYYRNKTIYFEKIKNNNSNRIKEESELLSEEIELTKGAERRVFLEKMLSNSIEVASAITALVTKEPVYFYLGGFVGECTRTYSFFYEKQQQQYWDAVESMNNAFSTITSQINTITELVSKNYKK